MWGAYSCMGAYERDVVVVIHLGAYTHTVLIFCECLLLVHQADDKVHLCTEH